MPTFKARYQATCTKCGKPIEVGHWMNWAPRKANSKTHFNCEDLTAMPESKQATTPSESGNSLNAMEALAAAMQPLLKQTASVDEDSVRAIVADELEQTLDSHKTAIVKLLAEEIAKVNKPQQIEVTIRQGESERTVNAGHTHKNFRELLLLCKLHIEMGGNPPINIWLPGPAGAGKTHAAEQVAKVLGLTFYESPALMEPYSLLGFRNANGDTVRTPFRECFENGGIFLQDEIDGSNPTALLSLNTAMANGHCVFPDGVVKRHKQCIIIAAANTFGLGGTNDYVGRVKLDAATLSRYVFLSWPYDEELERALTGNAKWVERVISIRAKVKSLGLKVLVTPRASYTGAALLAAGIPQTRVEEMTIKQGMTDEQWRQVKG